MLKRDENNAEADLRHCLVAKNLLEAIYGTADVVGYQNRANDYHLNTCHSALHAAYRKPGLDRLSEICSAFTSP